QECQPPSIILNRQTMQLSDTPTPIPYSSQSFRSSIQSTFANRVSSFVKMAKSTCGEGGPCYGYSDPCGQECLKQLVSKGLDGTFQRNPFGRLPRQQTLIRSSTAP